VKHVEFAAVAVVVAVVVIVLAAEKLGCFESDSYIVSGKNNSIVS